MKIPPITNLSDKSATSSSTTDDPGSIIDGLLAQNNNSGIRTTLETIQPTHFVPGLDEKLLTLEKKYPSLKKIRKECERIRTELSKLTPTSDAAIREFLHNKSRTNLHKDITSYKDKIEEHEQSIQALEQTLDIVRNEVLTGQRPFQFRTSCTEYGTGSHQDDRRHNNGSQHRESTTYITHYKTDLSSSNKLTKLSTKVENCCDFSRPPLPHKFQDPSSKAVIPNLNEPILHLEEKDDYADTNSLSSKHFEKLQRTIEKIATTIEEDISSLQTKIETEIKPEISERETKLTETPPQLEIYRSPTADSPITEVSDYDKLKTALQKSTRNPKGKQVIFLPPNPLGFYEKADASDSITQELTKHHITIAIEKTTVIHDQHPKENDPAKKDLKIKHKYLITKTSE